MAERQTDRTLRELVRVLASHALGMVLIVAVVLVAAGAATLLAPRVYRSEVQMMAVPTKLGSPLESRAGARDEVALFVLTQRQIVLSDHVLASALKRLDNPQTGPEYDQQEVTQWISENPGRLGKIRQAVKVLTPGGGEASFTQTFTIRVDWPEDRGLTSAITSKTREQAARQATELARCVKDTYLARYKQLETGRAVKAADFLNTQALAAASRKRREAGDALSDFIKKNLKADLALVHQMYSGGAAGSVGLQTLVTENEGEAKVATAEIDELSQTQRLLLQELTPFVPAEELAREIMDVDQADAMAAAMKRVQDATARRALRAKPNEKITVAHLVVPEPILQNNEGIKAMQFRAVALLLQLAAARSRYTEAYQGLADMQTEYDKTLTEMIASLRRELRRASHELSRLNARRSSLMGMVQADRKKLEQLASLTADYERIRRDLDTTQSLYDKEVERVVSAQTAEGLAKRHILVSVMNEASPAMADRPTRPIVWLNLVVAAFAGVVLATIYAFVSDHFDHTIKSVDDAERYLGVPVLASVPKLGRRIIQTR